MSEPNVTNQPNISNLVPLDVWAEIFLTTKEPNPTDVPTLSSCPLNLVLVCIGWKTLAYSMPNLWSDLHVRLISGAVEKRIKSTKLWLARAKTRPLTLSIDMFPLHKTRSRALYYILIPFLGRLKNLRLHAHFQHIIRPFISAKDKAMPLLETAEILVETRRREYRFQNASFDKKAFNINFDQSPLLRLLNVTINGELTGSRILEKTPMDCLTELHITDRSMGARDVYKLLSVCINLVECTLHTSDFAERQSIPDGDSDATPVTLPHLQNFRILFDVDIVYAWNTHQLMGNLVFPCLVLLDIRIAAKTFRHSAYNWDMLYNSLNQFQRRSDCPLESICFQLPFGRGAGPGSLANFFNIVPTLTSLHLIIRDYNATSISPEIIEYLTWFGGRKTLPDLSKLHLEFFTRPRFRYIWETELKEILSNMILSRCPPSAQQRLRSVKLALTNVELRDQIMVQMLRDKAPGLVVELEEYYQDEYGKYCRK